MYLTDEFAPLRVPPDRDYTAEVVVLLTSLGVKRREFNSSNRAKELLEIKKAHFKIIDFNLDTNMEASTSGSRVNQADLDIVRGLYKSNRIRQDPSAGVITLPQIIIDGVNIGDGVDLQCLEDENILESVLKRETCAKCLRPRQPTDSACKLCDALFTLVMPKRQSIEEALATFPKESDDEEIEFFNLLGQK